ncbi:MAG TPA: DNA-directed RNA polymerase subunit omega [Ignavibacteriaceae bacterium]|jgi:DNA-directed RNA polymerase subunit K/omega|nr:MAG: DNA-directed RNA polymerase subunit omega [Ignavibacteria bacterium ADurb.Bin266]OQY74103.1 MAG: DNA-directed RNA polymerase subunit omega [Ignavibacteriales bacterium UTCHB2]HQF41515.1 DNA-directed RNA polymerase subunit omega [Ignavibacteriaceae bacterium]HQI41985.1 DNA-directed RNA polymerase subunit omega [Ignavibacteriaceae bacterium]HQJ45418.1 DNA-directed RNA polymerase subunit omega [Ignavibacteriaceae bacterium]
MNLSPIDLREIDERAENVYEAIIVAARRARQINSENKIEFNALLNTIPATGSDDEAEDVTNPAQLKMALDFEKRPKPHLQALDELLEGQIKFKYKK